MKIAFLSLAWIYRGGRAAYQRHLVEALRANGVDVECYATCDVGGDKSWIVREAPEIVLTNPTYDIVHINGVWKKEIDYLIEVIQNCRGLVRYPRYVITVHDTAEIKGSRIKELVDLLDALVIFIRPTALRNPDMGFSDYVKYIPHPYMREQRKVIKRSRRNVVVTSKVTYRKRIEMVLESDCGIQVWSSNVNSRYNHFILKQYYENGIYDYPYYMGGFDSPSDVYPSAAALVDLTRFDGDGGGTQYTFLEAMDYGVRLLLSREWYQGPDDELKPGKHYTQINSVEHLRRVAKDIMRGRHREQVDPDVYEEILRNHDHAKVGGQYLKVYWHWRSGRRESFVRKNINYFLT